ncbi:MAG: efflux transporter periplasmic adaptor subunit [Flavobacteriaceae bacterium CG2_30_34_30]|nr:MAG: efflux transporter periplasmic adaptor subunit [Flavobacteriaceae bacterium CG2_30_34_30]PIQ17534.1 MAG: efflux transporter periplasmic adaptor subunit [Flavobacteriaceae bacterium CG18_big_fil_WC_8_21_14_2_50_34_36]PIV48428.1 MAG: efflux RND transporter periplasmic adaptor subunit [Flavobacteriaceae bacterium CG02_land_8_20_14_3_00_34_13]
MKKIQFLFMLLFAVIITSCGGDKKNEATQLPAILVQVNEVSESTTSQYISASGTVEAENSATLSTRMMGFVNKVHVKTGQEVRDGQLVVSINNTDLQAKKAQAEAGVLQAAAGFNNAKKDYDRFVNLFQQQSATQKELDDMTSRFEMAKAGLEGAKQVKKEVLAQFSYANITAPFSGIVTNTFVKEGDMANPGMPLLSVEGISKLQVKAMVSEGNITAIKNGMPVKVLLKSMNKEVDGKVSEVSLSAKNTGGQYVVKINLDENDASILSGMFVNVQFPVEKVAASANQNEVLLVPESALVTYGQLTGIYTIGNENTAILRWLRTGKTYGNQVEVLSGLTADEKYIISAEGKLFNGAKVAIK